MTFKRTAAATALASTLGIGLSLGFAGPAQADPVMQGVYTYTQDGLDAQNFTVYPSCVPVVGDLREPLELAVACRLHVATGPELKGGDARLTGGLWTYSTTTAEGMQCPDGSWAPTTEVYKFDDVAMTGTRSVFHNAVCGLQPGEQSVPFRLAYKEPLPMPVKVYPLDCEPWGLRLCT
ncbi:hypothetical protein BTO20_12930 [Mycobacterium dioxanotrophicus]|uniref:Secreted protein n=1 Tax=Mycobacterium dioxanotrophicus TaxID=482462 RepID=A0A1Y0C2E6_9MYCO|nr:hypothetical protein [Mycobacterium dioxanotrophicus]ART69369.1 hypothetical protein BTO20_12930 [Mycobacterium dioxanotrophicus]